MRFEALQSEAIKVPLCGTCRRVFREININILDKPIVSLSTVENIEALRSSEML